MLKLNVAGAYPRCFESGVWLKMRRISSHAFTYVTGFDRGERPIGSWSISTTLSKCSAPWMVFTPPTISPRCCLAECSPVSFVSSAR